MTEVGTATEQRAAREAFLEALVYDDPVQLYERAPCGFLSTTPDGLIVKCNATFRTWLDLSAGDIVGKLAFVDLLTPGSRIYHETHYAPALLMQGSLREIALDLVRGDGRRLPVLVNATMDRDEHGTPKVIRIAVFDAAQLRAGAGAGQGTGRGVGGEGAGVGPDVAAEPDPAAAAGDPGPAAGRELPAGRRRPRGRR